jgi:DNA-nicking Smr family endonuclease
LLGQGDVARHHREQAMKAKQRMEDARRRAALSMWYRKNRDLDVAVKIDLHGLRVLEALEVLDDFLSGLSLKAQQGQAPEEVTIITGRGAHTRDGVARIRNMVVQRLRRFGIQFTLPANNPGIVVLHPRSLGRALRELSTTPPV